MPITRLKCLYLAYFSKPEAERCLYRTIRKHGVRKILEIGIGNAQRAVRMIEVATQRAGDEAEIHYTGIDLFEARPAGGETLTLKAAHQLLTSTGARAKLVPGDAYDALARTANSLAGTDLIVIAADQSPDAMNRAWFYVPRLLHDRSLLFHEQAADDDKGDDQFFRVSSSEIDRLAAQASRRRAA